MVKGQPHQMVVEVITDVLLSMADSLVSYMNNSCSREQSYAVRH